MAGELNIKLHKKYFLRALGLLPERATEYDSSRTALGYFCISGLAVLNTLDEISEHDRTQWADWFLSNMTESLDGFRGSSTHRILGSPENDPANLPSTYFTIMSLAALRDTRVKHLNVEKISKFVGRCQRKDGSFAPNWSAKRGAFGENDPRCNYMAIGILRALNVPSSLVHEVMDVESSIQYLLSTKSYDGGFSQSSFAEAHSGLTFCVLAALDLVLKYDTKNRKLRDLGNWDRTIRWLAHRQITGLDNHYDESDKGGLNGRTGKPADSCYAFWSSASLEIIEPGLSSKIYDTEAIEAFLLTKVQHPLFGGFAKIEGVHPDQLHSYLSLTALSLLNTQTKQEYGLANIVPSLCVTESTAKWLAERP